MNQQSGDSGGQDFLKTLQDMQQRLERLEQMINSITGKPVVTPPPLPQTPPAPPKAPAIPAAPVAPAAPTKVKAPEPQPQVEKPRKIETPAFIPPELEAEKFVAAKPEVKIPEPPVAKPKRSDEPEKSFEQQIGQKWFLVAGIIVSLLAGVFFFKLAYDKGWIVPTPPMRCLVGAIAGFIVLAIGEITLRRGLRFFAGGMFALGVVGLYLTSWAASPNGLFPDYNIISENVAFAAMIAVTILGIALSLRTGMIFCAVIALVGALATPILLSSGVNRQRELMVYILAVDLGFLGLGLLKKWFPLSAIALGGTIVLIGGWAAQFLGAADSSLPVTAVFSWLYLAAFIAYAVLSTRLTKANFLYADILMRITSLLAMTLWIRAEYSVVTLLSFALVLQIILQPLSLLHKRWRGFAAIGFILTTYAFFAAIAYSEPTLTELGIFSWASLVACFSITCIAEKLGRSARGAAYYLIGVPAILGMVLWNSVGFSNPVLLSFTLVLQAALLGISLWGTRYKNLSLFAIVTTMMGFTAACNQMGNESHVMIVVLGWVSMGLFVGYVLYGQLSRKITQRYLPAVCILAPGLLMVLMWSLVLQIPAAEILPQLCALNVIVLGLYLLLKLNETRVVALLWTALGIILTMMTTWWTTYKPLTVELTIQYSVWIWIYFAIFTCDVLLRSLRKMSWSNLHVDTAMSFLLTGGMFASTYFLGLEFIGRGMGIYTFGLSAGAAVLSLILQRRGLTVLATAYFIQGLALLMFAAGIQFDNTATTVSWAGIGLAMMLLAKKWNNILLLLMPVVATGAAVIHFLGYELQYNPAVFDTCFSVGGVGISNALVIATGLALSMLAIGTILQVGRPVKNHDIEDTLGMGFFYVAAAMFCVRCIIELPSIPSTWCVLVAAKIVVVLALVLRQRMAIQLAALLLVVGAVKWMFHDLLFCKVEYGCDLESAVIFNWSIVGGLVIAVLMGSLNVLSKWREIFMLPAIAIALGLGAWFVVLWGGSFEIDRVVLMRSSQLADSGKALQMGLSLWWALCATAMLVWGFVRNFPGLRYFAICVFLITLGKVFVVDMRGVDAAYRILSFLGLGMLLVAASWLYNRHFKTPKAKNPERGE
ncbi:MAG: DUF2339 domain-containing protein [Phycisphaerae bacterium]|nr:DUF2339 domain-containing protein [Phycisphaerae bacterium]